MLSHPVHVRNLRPSRRKSCTECIKAKRRCDQGSIACARCAKQKLECRYIPAPTPDPIGLSTPSNKQNDTIEWSQTEQNDALGGLEFNTSPGGNLYNTTLDMVPGMEDLFSSNMENLIFSDAYSPTLFTPTQIVTTGCSHLLSSLATSRLDYGITQLKLAPSKMVHENQTPWSHSLLYEEQMPGSMHDAIGACALYLTKNDTNSSFIFRHIELRVSELLAGPMPSTSLELISRTQALILYQIIRIFDGDISARAQADLTIPHLEISARSLQSLIPLSQEEQSSPASVPLYPTHPTKILWNSYILHESARRTSLLAFYLLSLYSLLKGQRLCDDHPPLTSLFTASKYLWEVRDVFEFATAWKEKKHWRVRDLEYGDLLEGAEGGDLDTFGKVLVVANMGIEDARGWFLERGCDL